MGLELAYLYSPTAPAVTRLVGGVLAEQTEALKQLAV